MSEDQNAIMKELVNQIHETIRLSAKWGLQVRLDAIAQMLDAAMADTMADVSRIPGLMEHQVIIDGSISSTCIRFMARMARSMAAAAEIEARAEGARR